MNVALLFRETLTLLSGSMNMTLLKLRGCLFAFLSIALPASTPAQTNAPTAKSSPATAPVSQEIVVLHDVVIGKGGDRDLHAEIAYPKGATAPLTALIYVHGGGWAAGTDKQSPIVELAQAGFFAASIEYRLSGEAKWPAQIQDCRLGVRWLRANAAQYHIDPNHIGVWGDSAGGHLVACLGTMNDVKEYEGDGGYPKMSSAVQAVVDYFGPTDFSDPADASRETAVEALLGVPYAQNPDLWKKASPLLYVKAGDPPVFIAHGDADVTVPIDQSILFDAALAKAGVPHQFLIVKNAGHGFAAKPGTTIDPSIADIHKAVFAFLNKYLKTP